MTDVTGPPADAYAQLQSYLRSNEQLLWWGRPDPDVWFSPADGFMVPFSLVWGGFALFWEISVIATGASPFFVIWGIPFVAVGAYMIFGRFLVKRHRKRRTAYGVTNQRAIIGIGNSTWLDLPIKDAPRAVRRHRDGRHLSVSLGNQGLFRSASFYGNTGLDFHNAYGGPVTFFDVTDGDQLLQALDRAQSSGADPG